MDGIASIFLDRENAVTPESTQAICSPAYAGNRATEKVASIHSKENIDIHSGVKNLTPKVYLYSKECQMAMPHTKHAYEVHANHIIEGTQTKKEFPVSARSLHASQQIIAEACWQHS